jgi:GNAT superfamily N-acetyltransferase
MLVSDLEIAEQPLTPANLSAYGEISIAFRVVSRLRLEQIDSGLGGLRLVEEPVHPPYIKDYDLDAGRNDEGPRRWLRWATANSCLLAATSSGQRIGGAALFTHTDGMEFLHGRLDTVALWDIRVAPEWRRRGAGKALFDAALTWSRSRGYRRLKIETQNINVAACRFYARQGCYLGAIERHAYGDLPDEVELIWYYDLIQG